MRVASDGDSWARCERLDAGLRYDVFVSMVVVDHGHACNCHHGCKRAAY